MHTNSIYLLILNLYSYFFPKLDYFKICFSLSPSFTFIVHITRDTIIHEVTVTITLRQKIHILFGTSYVLKYS